MSDPVEVNWHCTIRQPLALYVPAGTTITIACPVHKDGHKIEGGPTYR